MRSTYPYTIINFKMATDLEHKGNVWLNWSWDDLYWTPNLDHWEIWPSYSYVDTNGSTRWMDMGSESLDQTNPSAREWSYYWELPLSAEEVYFRLRPIAKNKSDGSPEWEEEFYTTEKKYFGGATKPDKPSAPSVTQRSTLGIQVVLSLTNVLEPENNKNVVKAEFQTIQYDNEFDTGVILNTVQGYVDDFGNIQAYTQIGTSYGYKFRVRLWGSKARTEDPNQVTVVSSDWSELTSEFTMGAPEQPQLKVTKFSNDKVQLEILTNAIPHHFQYEIAPSTSVFDAVDEWERENQSIKEDSEARTAALLSLGIIDEQTKEGTVKKFTIPVPASGQDFAVYRVRSVSSDENAFYSSWSDVTEDSTLIFSDGLRAPIIWSSSEFAEVGDPSMQLCIMHNSPNGSPACRCQIGWSVNRETANEHWEWLNPPSGQSGNTVFYYNLDISAFDEETVIYWKARTFEGNVPIEENSSPMSEIKHFAIHAKPDVQLIFPDLSEVEEHDYPVMTSYPLKYRTQTTYYDSVTNPIEIISYEFNIISAQTYRRFDKEGRLQVIKAGDVIWNYLDTSKYYDVDRLLTAADCTLDNGVLYYFQVTVALSNGSTGNNSYRDERDIYHPGKEFMVSLETEEYTIQCNHTINRDTVALYLSPYAVKYEGTGLLPGEDPVPTYPNNVELAVYRKNDDGTFVKIDDNIPNDQALFITDPHPNLAGAEYRIVGIDMDSGKMTYYDPPPIDMGCTDIILQWDEDYANKPDNGDLRDYIPNLGNIVRLPYNIDVSESANIDNEMVKYVGRKDPVSYYGTQTGYTASWSTEIPKYDKDTIKMLRKLQVYPGDVYVREPNGTGYWAHVTVTFPLNHCALTVSVSINITRVEGGK